VPARHGLASCLDEARESIEAQANEILSTLSAGGVFTEEFEWRTGTYMERGIAKLGEDYFRCWSKTGGLWEVWLNDELEALLALGLLSNLHMSFFYSLGWPSWDPPPGWKPHSARNACERYLTELWEETRREREQDRDAVAAELSASGTWKSEALVGDLSLRAGVDVRLSARGLQLSTVCPTPLRALEVGLVYRNIAADISAAFSLA
jgi:hypothetical protein